MSPLAVAVYEFLRVRTGLPDPRITYGELAAQLREQSADFEFVTPRSPALYAALNEIGELCRQLRLPCLPALVVRADTRRPGEGYHDADSPRCRGERIAAWQREVEAVCSTTFPPCAERLPRPVPSRQPKRGDCRTTAP